MLEKIIRRQKRELTLKLSEKYVERHLLFQPGDNSLIKVIQGPRRCGKSTLAIHLAHQNTSFGYANFDDEQLVGLPDYEALIAAIDAAYNTPGAILFDEIQNVNGWELFVNRLQRLGRKLYITGSNAHLLSRELSTHLTGRHEPIVLFPFSYAEYCIALRGETNFDDGEHGKLLRNYLNDGGYPEPCVKKIDRPLYLSTLLDSILFKDIVKRKKIRAAANMEDLAKYMLSNICSEYSLRSLAEVTKSKSPHTIDKYLSYLDEAYMFFTLKRFSYKMKEQAKANKKIYCIDNGLVSSSAFNFSPGMGKLAENAVAVSLYKSAKNRLLDVFFWKSSQGYEVDFLIFKNRKVRQLIQVCWDLSRKKTRERELRALLTAAHEFKCKDLLIISESEEGTEKVEWFGAKGKVQYIPLWKWLLS